MSRRVLRFVAWAAGAGGFGYVVLRQDWWAAALQALFPGSSTVTFPSASVAQLVGQHLAIVLASSALVVAVGLPLGVWVTRDSGRDFRELVSAVVDFGQAFPPVAVLALMMPLLGLGPRPAIVALFLYGLFPVVSGAMTGLDAVDPSVLDSARGMGMGRWRTLFAVELPLAARPIMAGIRTSVIYAIGTATVAAATGSGGLGSPIYSGINTQNGALVLEGAVAAAALAVLADTLLALIEESVTPAT